MQDNKTKIRKASWQEVDTKFWGGEAPKLDIQWDALYSFMLAVVIRLNKRHTTLDDVQLIERFIQLLSDNEVLREERMDILEEVEEVEPATEN